MVASVPTWFATHLQVSGNLGWSVPYATKQATEQQLLGTYMTLLPPTAISIHVFSVRLRRRIADNLVCSCESIWPYFWKGTRWMYDGI